MKRFGVRAAAVSLALAGILGGALGAAPARAQASDRASSPNRTGGPGRDILLGEEGNDTLKARDGTRDTVDCGPGRDVALVDALDAVRRCEVVRSG